MAPLSNFECCVLRCSSSHYAAHCERLQACALLSTVQTGVCLALIHHVVPKHFFLSRAGPFACVLDQRCCVCVLLSCLQEDAGGALCLVSEDLEEEDSRPRETGARQKGTKRRGEAEQEDAGPSKRAREEESELIVLD